MRSPTLILGNSLIELQKLPSNSVDLIFADPPYWMRVTGKLKRVKGQILMVAMMNGTISLMINKTIGPSPSNGCQNVNEYSLKMDRFG